MKKRGFTLVEVLLVLFLLGLVIVVSVPMLVAAFQGQKASYNEYDVQNRLRTASLHVNDIINESFAIFTIPADNFEVMENGKIVKKFSDSEPWDYFGVSADGKELISYVYKNSGENAGTHERVILATAGEGFKFELEFNKPVKQNQTTGSGELLAINEPLGQKFIGYTIEIVKEGGSGVDTNKVYKIQTELEAKNANQVVFRTSEYKPAAAIAVRRLDRFDDAKSHVTFVHYVLDNSGSMNSPISSGRLPRIKELKKALKDIVEDFGKEDDVELIFYWFSRHADFGGRGHTIHSKNFPKSGNSVVLDADATKTEVKKYDLIALKTEIDAKGTGGGTNLGDALRRVYHKIKLINEKYMRGGNYYNSGATCSHYLIVLTDGEPNAYSCLKNGDFFAGDGDAKYPVEVKPHVNKAFSYVEKMAKLLIGSEACGPAEPLAESQSFKKTFIIGFSRESNMANTIDKIAGYFEIVKGTSEYEKQVIVFKNEDIKLEDVFKEIKMQIMLDESLLTGPSLK